MKQLDRSKRYGNVEATHCLPPLLPPPLSPQTVTSTRTTRATVHANVNRLYHADPSRLAGYLAVYDPADVMHVDARGSTGGEYKFKTG